MHGDHNNYRLLFIGEHIHRDVVYNLCGSLKLSVIYNTIHMNLFLLIGHMSTILWLAHSPTSPAFITCGSDYKMRFFCYKGQWITHSVMCVYFNFSSLIWVCNYLYIAEIISRWNTKSLAWTFITVSSIARKVWTHALVVNFFGTCPVECIHVMCTYLSM